MKNLPFKIDIECDYKELWRYNLALVGEVRKEGERIDMVRHLDEVASVGDDIAGPPEGYCANRNIGIRSAAGDSLTLYIYIVAHSIPHAIDADKPTTFELKVTIHHGDSQVYNRRHSVNILSGDNIEIHIDNGKLRTEAITIE